RAKVMIRRPYLVALAGGEQVAKPALSFSSMHRFSRRKRPCAFPRSSPPSPSRPASPCPPPPPSPTGPPPAPATAPSPPPRATAPSSSTASSAPVRLLGPPWSLVTLPTRVARTP